MNRINIVYLVFGNTQAYHTQAYFSILTALKGKREGDKVTVYTDAPRHYARLASHIEVRELGKATLEHAGPHPLTLLPGDSVLIPPAQSVYLQPLAPARLLLTTL